MKINYHTQKGSIYTHLFEKDRDYWIMRDKDGKILSLADGLHISKESLEELISDYSSTLLDKTSWFDEEVKKDFFDDAKREQLDFQFETQDTVIFFTTKTKTGMYIIGCSSIVEIIEKVW